MTRASIICCAIAGSLMLIAKWTYQPLPRPQISRAPCVLDVGALDAFSNLNPSVQVAPFNARQQTGTHDVLAVHQELVDDDESSVVAANFITFDGSDAAVKESEKSEAQKSDAAKSNKLKSVLITPLSNSTNPDSASRASSGKNGEQVPDSAQLDAKASQQRSAFDGLQPPLTVPLNPPVARRTTRTRTGRTPSTLVELEPIAVAIQKKMLTANMVEDPRLSEVEPARTGINYRPVDNDNDNDNVDVDVDVDVESTSDSATAQTIAPNSQGSNSDDVASDDANSTDVASSIGEMPVELPEPNQSVRPIQLSAEMRVMHEDIETCLAYYYARPEDTKTRSPWGVMHSLIAFGVDTNVIVNGEQVNAIGWLTWNQPCRGMKLFKFDGAGRMSMPLGPGYQGHEGQLLAMLAQSRVRLDYPMKIEGRDLTVKDLVAFEQKGCREKTELTFKLIGLVHYLDTDASWRSDDGGYWDFEKLIREELAQKVIGAACGGTHRMMGFTYAVKKRGKEGKPMTGQWRRARDFVNAYHNYAFKLQNRDGSFSTKWFEGREAEREIDRRIQTTGHILEWLLCSLPQDQLQDPRIVRAVEYLTYTLWRNRGHKWEIGPQGHALHALVLYDQMVFGKQPGDGGRRLQEVAQRKGLTR